MPELNSLHVTYVIRDLDKFGPRAAVRRAVLLHPPFRPDVYTYWLKVPSDVSNLEIATPVADSCCVELSGHRDLAHGWNTIEIAVRNTEDNTEIVYVLRVERPRVPKWMQVIGMGACCIAALLAMWHTCSAESRSTCRRKHRVPGSANALGWGPTLWEALLSKRPNG